MSGKKMDIDRLKQLVLEEAADRKLAAGYGGRADDGGARMMMEQVRFYTMGEQGEIPKEWESLAYKLDPEYAEYQRLKAKFERS